MLVAGNKIVIFPACFISNDSVFSTHENWGGDRKFQMKLTSWSANKFAFLDESKSLHCLDLSSFICQKDHVKDKIKTHSYLNYLVKYHSCLGCFLSFCEKVLGEIWVWEVEKDSSSLKVFFNFKLVEATEILKPHKSDNLEKGHVV